MTGRPLLLRAMFRVQIMGLPLPTYRKLKPDFDAWRTNLEDGVEVRAVPSPSEESWNYRLGEAAVNNAVKNLDQGFTHILVPLSYREVPHLRRRFRYELRVIGLTLDMRNLTWPALKSELERAISFERKWCRIARPSDVRHPLLLPPPSFEVHRDVGDFWKECDCYGQSAELTKVHNLLDKVWRRHRKKVGRKQLWMDTAKRCFRWDQSRHALTPDERSGRSRFRFCFEVPAGFHYDVTHERGESFTVLGTSGSFVSRHANVDPWGGIRGQD